MLWLEEVGRLYLLEVNARYLKEVDVSYLNEVCAQYLAKVPGKEGCTVSERFLHRTCTVPWFYCTYEWWVYGTYPYERVVLYLRDGGRGVCVATWYKGVYCTLVQYQ
jgi:hypothetical protein